MPTYFVPAGPNIIVTTGSFIPVLECVNTYILDCISKIQRDHLASMTHKRSVITAYHEHCEEHFKQTVYSDGYGTWIKSSPRFPSRITAIYPSSFPHYRNMLMHPRWED